VSPINPSPGHASNKAAIAGSVVGVVVLGALVGGFLFYSRRKKHQRQNQGVEVQDDPFNYHSIDTSAVTGLDHRNLTGLIPFHNLLPEKNPTDFSPSYSVPMDGNSADAPSHNLRQD
jgi:hypothetical protein